MTMTVKKDGLLCEVDMPDNFLELQKCFVMLRPITTTAEYKKALHVAELFAPRNSLTKAQSDYQEILANNIAAYEKSRYHGFQGEPVDLLKFLLQENNMSGSALGRLLGNRGLGCAILRGERALSKTHIKKLAGYFAVSPALFLPG